METVFDITSINKRVSTIYLGRLMHWQSPHSSATAVISSSEVIIHRPGYPSQTRREISTTARYIQSNKTMWTLGHQMNRLQSWILLCLNLLFEPLPELLAWFHIISLTSGSPKPRPWDQKLYKGGEISPLYSHTLAQPTSPLYFNASGIVPA